jgi:hypothetical protein
MSLDRATITDILQRIRAREPGTRILVDDDAELQLCPGDFVPLEPRTGRLLFVDGGNAEVLGGPGFTLQLVRTAWLLFDGAVCAERGRREGLVLVRAKNADTYDIDGFGITPPVKLCSRTDRALAKGRHAVEPQAVAEEVRLLLELETAANLAELAAPDIVVRDGSLVPETAAAGEFLQKLADAARKRGAVLAGLSKTSRAITDTGVPASEALLRLGPAGRWRYGAGAISFVRLHEKSRHVFRLDAAPAERAGDAAALLASHAADAGFPGYPYGLAAADQLARVSRQEAERQKAVFLATAGKELQAALAGTDAHGVLDQLHLR